MTAWRKNAVAIPAPRTPIAKVFSNQLLQASSIQSGGIRSGEAATRVFNNVPICSSPYLEHST
eukprot:134590-Pyramimonas_sp.AAC.1